MSDSDSSVFESNPIAPRRLQQIFFNKADTSIQRNAQKKATQPKSIMRRKPLRVKHYVSSSDSSDEGDLNADLNIDPYLLKMQRRSRKFVSTTQQHIERAENSLASSAKSLSDFRRSQTQHLERRLAEIRQRHRDELSRLEQEYAGKVARAEADVQRKCEAEKRKFEEMIDQEARRLMARFDSASNNPSLLSDSRRAPDHSHAPPYRYGTFSRPHVPKPPNPLNTSSLKKFDPVQVVPPNGLNLSLSAIAFAPDADASIANGEPPFLPGKKVQVRHERQRLENSFGVLTEWLADSIQDTAKRDGIHNGDLVSDKPSQYRRLHRHAAQTDEIMRTYDSSDDGSMGRGKHGNAAIENHYLRVARFHDTQAGRAPGRSGGMQQLALAAAARATHDPSCTEENESAMSTERIWNTYLQTSRLPDMLEDDSSEADPEEITPTLLSKRNVSFQGVSCDEKVSDLDGRVFGEEGKINKSEVPHRWAHNLNTSRDLLRSNALLRRRWMMDAAETKRGTKEVERSSSHSRQPKASRPHASPSKSAAERVRSVFERSLRVLDVVSDSE